MKIELCGLTDVGLRRENNEDSILLWDLEGQQELAHGKTIRLNLKRSPCLVAVMDGMGGEAGGEVASGTAAQVLRDRAVEDFRLSLFDDPRSVLDCLAECTSKAHDQISRMAKKDKSLHGMGTTLTAAIISKDRLHIAHVGDSRLYHLREGILRKMTVDHTLVQRLVSSGQLSRDEVKDHPQRNILVQSIGGGGVLNVERLVAPIESGDALLLSSDGLHDLVDQPVISGILGNRGTPEKQCQRMIEEAKKGGGSDNISAIIGHLS